MRILGIAFLLSMIPNCSGDDQCEMPAELQYDCEPQVEEAGACVGGPTINGIQRDPDLNFALGCAAGFSHCENGELAMSRTCECVTEFPGQGAPIWGCPL